MYDTICMKLQASKARGISFMDLVPPMLDNISEHYFQNSQTHVISGYLDKKLQISVTDKRISIPKGNLKGWFFDNPFYDFKRGSTEEAISKLSDSLMLPMELAEVTRVDLGPTISMKHPPDVYYPYLEYKQGYDRHQMNNGIYFQNKTDTLVFYHKQRQCKAKGYTIPDDKKKRNHARIEQRIPKGVKHFFKKDSVIVKDLYDEAFYMTVLDSWKESYFQIEKKKSKMAALAPTGSSKEFINYLACVGLSKIGYSEAMKQIKEWQQMDQISKKQASDLRKKIIEINRSDYFEKGNELMEELDQKVNQVVKYYR